VLRALEFADDFLETSEGAFEVGLFRWFRFLL